MRKRILIVEDDSSVREALKEMLERGGYAVVSAADGQEGVHYLNHQPFDLLLLDLNLPKVSGFDVIDFATEHHPSLPIIVLSGQLDQCEPGAFVGTDILMQKPPDVGLLLEKIEELLNEPPERRLQRLACGHTGARVLTRFGGKCMPLAKFPSWRAGQDLPGSSSQLLE